VDCALVTGGSKGIGRAICLQLAKDHQLHIIINYSSDDEAAQYTLNKIVTEGGTGELLKFKVEDKPAVDSAIAKWLESNPDKNIKVLVNNAGIIKDGLFIWMSEANWDDVTSISLKGMFNVTQNILRHMMKRKRGRIINISSISGLKGVPGQVNYAAAKAGIIGATKSLSQEVARIGITVNAVAPGFINTDMTKELEMEKYVKLIPVERMGEPEEVAHLVSFLASDKSSYITGEVINVNGGLYS
jgi:3-oxoacyl-[acyl-carrier protein] reductase